MLKKPELSILCIFEDLRKIWPCVYSHRKPASCISPQPAVLTTPDAGPSENQVDRALHREEGSPPEHFPT